MVIGGVWIPKFGVILEVLRLQQATSKITPESLVLVLGSLHRCSHEESR